MELWGGIKKCWSTEPLKLLVISVFGSESRCVLFKQWSLWRHWIGHQIIERAEMQTAWAKILAHNDSEEYENWIKVFLCTTNSGASEWESEWTSELSGAREQSEQGGASEWESERTNKWAKRSARARRAGRSSEWVSGASKWVSGRASGPMPMSQFFVNLCVTGLLEPQGIWSK